MPKGREAQEKQWACEDCRYNKTTVRMERHGRTVTLFECRLPDPKVNVATSGDVLATCDSWEYLWDRKPVKND